MSQSRVEDAASSTSAKALCTSCCAGVACEPRLASNSLSLRLYIVKERRSSLALVESSLSGEFSTQFPQYLSCAARLLSKPAVSSGLMEGRRYALRMMLRTICHHCCTHASLPRLTPTMKANCISPIIWPSVVVGGLPDINVLM